MDSRKAWMIRKRSGTVVYQKGEFGAPLWAWMSEDEARDVDALFGVTSEPVDMQGPVPKMFHCDCVFPQGMAHLYLTLSLEVSNGPTLTTI